MSTSHAPSPLEVIRISPTDTPSITKATSLIASAFANTPICIALISDIDSLTPSTPHSLITHDRVVAHFADKIHKVTSAGAILSHAGDWSAISVWDPPDFVALNEPDSRRCALLEEWKEKITRVKAEYLGTKPADSATTSTTTMTEEDRSGDDGQPAFLALQARLRPHWHMNYLIRNPTSPPVPGAVSAVVRPFLKRAEEDGVPAWLEATTPYAVSIYEHLGYRVAEKVTIGKGRYGVDGWPEDGGEGTSCWAMIYDRHLTS